MGMPLLFQGVIAFFLSTCCVHLRRLLLDTDTGSADTVRSQSRYLALFVPVPQPPDKHEHRHPPDKHEHRHRHDPFALPTNTNTGTATTPSRYPTCTPVQVIKMH